MYVVARRQGAERKEQKFVEQKRKEQQIVEQQRSNTRECEVFRWEKNAREIVSQGLSTSEEPFWPMLRLSDTPSAAEAKDN